MKGFSPRNLKYMRTFAQLYPEKPIVQQVVAQLPWGQNVLLIDKVKDPAARLWYAQKVVENGWSRAVLWHQIDTKLYERQSKSKKLTNFGRALPAPQSNLAHEMLKDPLDGALVILAQRVDAISSPSAAPSGPPVESKEPRVVLAPSALAPMKIGETVKIQASVLDAEPGDSPVQYTWSGSGESSGNMVSIEAKNPGKFNVSVSAAGPGRSLGSASLEYEVEPITVKIEQTSPATDTIPVGATAQFRATAISGTGQAVKGLNFQW